MISGKNNIDDIIFERRNKDYGAFQIRKKYKKTLLISTVIVLAFFALFFGSLQFYYYKLEIIDSFVLDNIVIIEMSQLPEEILTPLPEEIPEEIKKEEAPPPPQIIDSTKQTQTTDTLSQKHAEVKDTVNQNIPSAKSNETETEDGFKTVVERIPQFPGGDKAYKEFISKNLIYPLQAKILGIQGSVEIAIKIDITGKVEEIKIVKSSHQYFSDEARRIVNVMPKWLPGIKNGKPVEFWIKLPLYFVLKPN